MSLQSILGDSRAPSDGGFFGNISSAFETGISKIGSEILPNWVAKQTGTQAKDQLAKTTYQSPLNATIPNTGTGSIETTTPVTGLQKVLADLKIGNIGTGGLLIMGMILIAAIVIIKKV